MRDWPVTKSKHLRLSLTPLSGALDIVKVEDERRLRREVSADPACELSF